MDQGNFNAGFRRSGGRYPPNEPTNNTAFPYYQSGGKPNFFNHNPQNFDNGMSRGGPPTPFGQGFGRDYSYNSIPPPPPPERNLNTFGPNWVAGNKPNYNSSSMDRRWGPPNYGGPSASNDRFHSNNRMFPDPPLDGNRKRKAWNEPNRGNRKESKMMKTDFFFENADPDNNRIDLRTWKKQIQFGPRPVYTGMKPRCERLFGQKVIGVTYDGRKDMFTEEEGKEFHEFIIQTARKSNFSLEYFRVKPKWSFTPFFQISCKSPRMYNWLLKSLREEKFWEKSLVVFAYDNRKNEGMGLRNITVEFPPDTEDAEEAFKILAKQNPNLDFSSWIILNSFKDEDLGGGLRVALNVNEETLKTLKSIDYRPYFLMGRVDFYIKDGTLKDQIRLDVSRAWMV